MEAAAACIAYLKQKSEIRRKMPMKKHSFNALFKPLERTASFAAFSAAILITGNASLAAVLHDVDRWVRL